MNRPKIIEVLEDVRAEAKVHITVENDVRGEVHIFEWLCKDVQWWVARLKADGIEYKNNCFYFLVNLEVNTKASVRFNKTLKQLIVEV